MTKILIPAGLMNHDIEFFDVENESMAIYQGRVHTFDSLPKLIRKAIWAKFKNDSKIMQSLHDNGFISKYSKIKKLTSCRFGGFDSVSDFKEGEVNQSEYFDCGFRNECPMEGIVCSYPTFNGHPLTPFDLKLIKLLATEMILPAIADEMSVCANTLDNKKKILFEKFEVLSRPRLVALAFENNLII